MTDFESGFAEGEAIAWMQRHEPLPQEGLILNERERGFWAARLPRGSEWENSRVRPKPVLEAA